MTRKTFVLSISLLAFFGAGVLQSNPADAQGRRRGNNPAAGTAAPRDASPPPAAESAPPPAPAPAPQTGRAVPRGSVQAVPPNARGGRVFVGPPIRSYYYYPRRYYPYGYGAFGLGYFYYDPYLWYPSPYGGYYGDGYGYGYYDPSGELRIQVKPNSGDVYVDGYFAGRVDDYDGVFQSLKLEPGAHHIEVRAPGYAPLEFDVRIDPGRKVTYHGVLVPARP